MVHTVISKSFKKLEHLDNKYIDYNKIMKSVTMYFHQSKGLECGRKKVLIHVNNMLTILNLFAELFGTLLIGTTDILS